MTAVKFVDITKRFGQVTALDRINLSIDAGELFFLLGPSGCGKSTLLRLIAGLHAPSEGRILFNDRDVTDLGTEQRNAVMCFQSYALWPHMNVRENIRFGLDIRKVSRAEADRRVAEVIDLVQLQPYAHRKPNELSGGQQQRVALARALVVKPDCLLLDEPLSNLDAKLRLEMRGEIRRICRASGLTAIYVTHDQKEALSIADRMAVLNHGRIEQIGVPQSLYLNPKNLFVAHFMGETNTVEGKVVVGDVSRAVVRTALGEVVSTRFVPQGLEPGMSVSVSLRPEAIQLGDAPSDMPNVYKGVLHDTIYLGESAQHLVNADKNGSRLKASLKVLELNPHHVARDEASEPVQFWIKPEDVVVLLN